MAERGYSPAIFAPYRVIFDRHRSRCPVSSVASVDAQSPPPRPAVRPDLLDCLAARRCRRRPFGRSHSPSGSVSSSHSGPNSAASGGWILRASSIISFARSASFSRTRIRPSPYLVVVGYWGFVGKYSAIHGMPASSNAALATDASTAGRNIRPTAKRSLGSCCDASLSLGGRNSASPGIVRAFPHAGQLSLEPASPSRDSIWCPHSGQW